MTQDIKHTALITGASSGVGVDFARELAKRSFNLILTARRIDRLEALRAELAEAFDVEIDIVASDLSSSEGANRLHADVRALNRDVSMLVNNAGHGKYGPMLEQSLAEIDSMIQLNTTSLTVLTRLFGEDFKERGGGYILNHASFSAIQPPPYYSVYAGTKAYVLAFSQALNHDLRRHGIKVSALCPGFFASEFLENAKQTPSFIVRLMMLQPRAVARAGIRGVLKGKPVIIPGLAWKALNLVMKMVPRSFATGLADFAVKH
ncbi:MAG: short-chain dehydrogenase [Planctomycetaceae bacterium]|nr:short-chain dehydrogenase [Planctomycetaceae bacterium]